MPQLAQKPSRRQDDRIHRSEVLHEQTTDHPATTRETAKIRRRLQQSAQLALRGGVGSAIVKRCNCPGAIHQGPVASAGDGDTNPGEHGALVSASYVFDDAVYVCTGV